MMNRGMFCKLTRDFDLFFDLTTTCLGNVTLLQCALTGKIYTEQPYLNIEITQLLNLSSGNNGALL